MCKRRGDCNTAQELLVISLRNGSEADISFSISREEFEKISEIFILCRVLPLVLLAFRANELIHTLEAA